MSKVKYYKLVRIVKTKDNYNITESKNLRYADCLNAFYREKYYDKDYVFLHIKRKTYWCYDKYNGRFIKVKVCKI